MGAENLGVDGEEIANLHSLTMAGEAPAVNQMARTLIPTFSRRTASRSKRTFRKVHEPRDRQRPPHSSISILTGVSPLSIWALSVPLPPLMRSVPLPPKRLSFPSSP